MYLMNTRPNICFDVNTLSQYLFKPRHVHLIVATHVMRYLKGNIDFGLYYDRDHDYRLYGFTDSYWAGSVTDNKSTSCGCYCLGSTMITWFSKKQSIVSLSMAEVEYIAAFSTSYESIWLQKMMSSLFDMDLDTTIVICDNQSCINMTAKPFFHDKSNHIEIQYFYIRDTVQKGAINFQYVSTDEQVVDVLTKPLSRVKFEYLLENLGVVRKDFPHKEEH